MSGLLEINLGNHTDSFRNINDVIRDEVNMTFETIDNLLESGHTEEEILEEWNNGFYSEDNHLESFDDLIGWLNDVGI